MIIVSIIIILIVILYCCFIVSGRCSKDEENLKKITGKWKRENRFRE